MSDNGGSPNSIDFQVNKDNLYREETITDLKIATIRKLLPVKADGSEDTERETIYIGSTQLGTPQGPIPLPAKLEANSFEEAMHVFPKAMEAETKVVIENFKRMQEQQEKAQKAKESRIITPGMH